MNNLSSYCGLVDAKIRASEKDLPLSYKITYSFGCKISVINGPFFAAVVVLNLQIPRLVHTHLVAGMAIWYGSPFTMAKTKIIYPKNMGASVAMNFTKN
jgi:hypothetical protein